MTMTKVRSGVNYIIPDFPIAAGNSGGPILDEHYQVVAIAAKGVRNLSATADAEPDVYAAVAIRHLVDLSTEE
jgi:S1-C subfamily serine protease